MTKPFDPESAENLPEIEKQWAVVALDRAEAYFKLISAMDPKRLRLCKIDDEIYEDFRNTFPSMNVNIIDQNEFNTNEKAKAKWRSFIMKYEKKIDDYNFGTLIRLNSEEDYTPENSFFVTRTQFYAIEIARNREGFNDKYFMFTASSPRSPAASSPRFDRKLECPCKKLIPDVINDHCKCKSCNKPLETINEFVKNQKDSIIELESIKMEYDETKTKYNELLEKYDELQNRYNDLEEQLAVKSEELEMLNIDYGLISTKVSDEMAKRVQFEQSKKKLSDEIEELTKALFEQANGLVANEAKARHKVEASARSLNTVIDDLKHENKTLQDDYKLMLKQCKVLMSAIPREDYEDMVINAQKEDIEFTNEFVYTDIYDLSLFDDVLIKDFINSSLSCISEDDWKVFKSFCNVLHSSKDIRKSLSTPFMKFFNKNIIEPCLTFKLTDTFTSKQLLDGFIMDTVDLITEDVKRFSQTSCKLCDLEIDRPYTLKISKSECLIDSTCYKTLKAIQNLFLTLSDVVKMEAVDNANEDSLLYHYYNFMNLARKLFYMKSGGLSFYIWNDFFYLVKYIQSFSAKSVEQDYSDEKDEDGLE